jgi:hypothetical protein
MQSKAEARDADDIFRVSEDATPEEKLEAMEWRKIIEKANAGLNADIEAAKSRRVSVADLLPRPQDPQDVRLEQLLTAAAPEGKLAKLSQIDSGLIEPQDAPSQTLNAALLPYAVAAGLCVLVSGGVLAYLVAGSPSAVVTQAREAEPPAPAAAPAREEFAAPSTGVAPRAQAQAAPALPTLFSNVAADRPESAAKPVQSEARQAAPSNWSETVETFREFVKAEVQKSSARAGGAR